MKSPSSSLLAIAAFLLASCSALERDSSAREWQRAECNRVIDSTDRERCMKRVDDMYGSGVPERRDPPKR